MLNGVAMKRVPQFCYLGSVITPDGDASAEIANRIGKATGVFKTMDTALWGRREIPASLKVRLFDSLILAILLYGVEATPLRVADTRALASLRVGASGGLWGFTGLKVCPRRSFFVERVGWMARAIY